MTSEELRDLSISPSSTQLDYRIEQNRLQSYKNWPATFIDPTRLAAAGFFYTGEDDKVRCFECKVEICQWREGDSPIGDHQRWQGSCRFLRGILCGNVPIGEDFGSVFRPVPNGRDECGLYGIEYGPVSSTDSGLCRAESQSQGTTESTPAEKAKRDNGPEDATMEMSGSSGFNRIDDARLCKICYDKEMNCVFVPCGHVVACVKCAQEISVCALCQEFISIAMRIYLS